MKTSTKVSSLIIVILSAVFIFGFSAAFFILPDKEMSENENRVLTSAPEFSFDSLVSGKLTEEIKDYFSDQFPLRGFFINVKGLSELMLGKHENNGIFYDFEQGYMIDRLNADFDMVNANLSSLSELNSALSNKKITVAIAPRKLDALSHLLPSSVSAASVVSPAQIDEICRKHSLESVDLYSPLTAASESGDYIYYRTDHHITTDGAYLIYLALAEKWGFEPYPRDYFTKETVTDDFYGTTWSASATAGISPDEIILWRSTDDEAYTVHIIDNGSEISGFYDLSYLSKKDKYSLFLSGTNAGVTITKNTDEARPKLLILNDSFANSVVPFLALHFDIEMTDPRFLRSGLYDKLENGGYDELLLLMNLDTLSSSDLLATVSVGIPK